MKIILCDKNGVSNCGADGKLIIDGRFGLHRINQTIVDYIARYKKNFPHYVAQWSHYMIVKSFRDNVGGIRPIIK